MKSNKSTKGTVKAAKDTSQSPKATKVPKKPPKQKPLINLMNGQPFVPEISEDERQALINQFVPSLIPAVPAQTNSNIPQAQVEEHKQEEDPQKSSITISDSPISKVSPEVQAIVQQLKEEPPKSQPNDKKRKKKEKEKQDEKLNDMEKMKLRQKVKVNYDQDPSEPTGPQEDSSLIKAAPINKLDTMVAFYDEFIGKPDNDANSQILIAELHLLLQEKLKELPNDRMDRLVQQFMVILKDNFDVWRQLRSRDRPRLWNSVTPKMAIDVILWKLENEQIPETIIGQYAQLVCSKIASRKFDCSIIDNRFQLADNLQAKIFANQLLHHYISYDANNQQTIQTKLCPLILCMKIGQIQICFDKVFQVQKAFNQDFQNTKTLKFTTGNKPASVNKNESRLCAAVIAVYTNIDEKSAVKFCNSEDYKILAHHGVCNVLNSIVKSRHMVLVRLLPMILVPTGKDFGELLLRMDEIDAGDQSILRVLLTAITLNKDQRLQPSQVLKLVSGIKQSGIQFAQSQLEMSNQDLGNLFLVLENGAKTQKDVNKSHVASWVQEEMKKMQAPKRDQFKQVYDRIESLVDEEILGKGIAATLYEKDYYQMYIAAHICLNMTPSLCQIYAGQGKTVIMLLCALYFIVEKNKTQVTFVTSSNLLMRQLQRDLTSLWKSGAGKYFKFGSVEDPSSIDPSPVMIVDEADLTMQYLVSFDRIKFELNGLYWLKQAQKVIYMSATMPVMVTDEIERALGYFEKNEFKSQYQITSKDADPYFITDKNFGTKDQMTEYIVNEVAEMRKLPKQDLYPMIFFIEEWDDEIILQIEKQIRLVYGQGFMIIREAKTLQMYQDMLKSQAVGAVIMPASMGRGLNIRFQLDSHVKIIANSDTLNWQDVCQMVGRSCRRFGLCKGTVYVKSGCETIDLAGGKNYLNRDQNAYDVNEGQYIAQALFEKFPLIKNIEMRKEIVNLTDDPVVWRVTKAEFAKKNPNVLKFLTVEQYRPTSKWSNS